ncbi:MAG: DUF4837 family protein [Bacteroidales bacterium]|nr:DUF4837 family protein [Bacteroidales bacterium]
MKKIIAVIAAVLALVSCKNSGKVLLPNVSGKAGEVIVVLDKADWEGTLGNEVRDLLADECPWLTPREPLYSLVNVVPSNFVDLFKVHRNIVFFEFNPQVEEGVILRNDVWASPQVVLQINAHDADSAVGVLKENSEVILNGIEQAERNRVINNTLLYEERNIAPQVREIMGGSPHFPSGYKLKKKTDDFIWIADEKQYTMQGVLIYKYPAAGNASDFSAENIIAHRNEALMNNVPGMFENTYMTTSDYITPTLTSMRYKGRDFVQTRGYWEVYNDYMGGPFVSHSFYTPDGGSILVLDAFVYAPKYDKRQYLRQVESLLYSFEWAEKKD